MYMLWGNILDGLESHAISHVIDFRKSGTNRDLKTTSQMNTSDANDI